MRIEYPWQRDEREAKAAAEVAAMGPAGALADQAGARPERVGPSTTQRLLADPRLDSADVPRPHGSTRRTN